MNTLNILLSYSYVAKLVKLSWHDILFGIEQGFLSSEAAINKAITELGVDGNSNQCLINLACLAKGESIHPYIDDFIGESSEEEIKEAKEKFLYCLLSWVYEQQEIYSDPLEGVEIIYADFDYPEVLTNIVRYMPSVQTTVDTLESNRERLYNNWKNYLDIQNSKYFA
jgi:hypothetical protein